MILGAVHVLMTAYTTRMATTPRKAVGNPTAAAVYCRISLARFGDTIKVDDQEAISRKLATDRGWTVADEHVFKDNSVSAWQRNRKRPGWDALLAAVEAREVQAIVVYHGDRLIRQPWDLEMLLRLADERGVRLASVMGERNLDSPDDRYILRIEAASACREVDATSRRLRRHHERRAEKGLHRPGGRGGRAFGFETDGKTHRPGEAAILNEVADRILAGEDTGSIGRDLNTRGVLTTAGNTWTHGALKKLLLRPRLAGLLVHNGVIVGPAAWEPILDRDKWETVRFTLERKASRFDYTTNARRYELTGIALCGSCGHGLAIRHNTRDESLRGYGCINPACRQKVHRSVHHLDLYVRTYVLAKLQDPRLLELLAGEDTSGAVAELETAEARRHVIFEDFADDDAMAADVLRVSIARLDARIEALRQRISRANSGHVLDGLTGISEEEWQQLPLSRRRAAIQALVRVTVFKSSKRGPGFDPSTVRLEPLI